MTQQTITRAELTEALLKTVDVSRTDASRFLETMLSLMGDALVDGDTVKLSRFGNFTVRQKRERLGRNPKTGEEVPITSRRVVTFRPSQLLREQIERAPPPQPASANRSSPR